MSAVRAAKSVTAVDAGADAVVPVPSPGANLDAMQDVLYDILANGIDPDQTEVSTKAVEQFLFEHARVPKTEAEFIAFFAAQGLSVRISTHRAPTALSLPPLVPRAPSNDAMPVHLPVELAVAAPPAPRVPVMESPLAVEITAAPELPQPPPLPAPARSRAAMIALWTGLASLAAMMVAGAAYGYATITRLEKDLDRAAQETRDNRAELKVLRHDAVGLESSVAATGEMLQRMDQKSDLLIETLLPSEPGTRPGAPKHAAAK